MLGAFFVMSCILASLLLIVRVVNTTSNAPGPLETLLPGAFWVDSVAVSTLLFVLVTGLVLLMRRKRMFYAWPVASGVLLVTGYLTWRSLSEGPPCVPGALKDCAVDAFETSLLYFEAWAVGIATGFSLLYALLILSPRARKTLRR